MAKQPPPQTKQPTTPLERWLARRKLDGNPFERWNAEHDRELPNYFVDVGNFDEILRQTAPCVVFARRGCGKTAQRQMLAAHCRPTQRDSDLLAVPYTFGGFERALQYAGNDINRVKPIHHVAALLGRALNALVDEARYDPAVREALTSPPLAPNLRSYIENFAPYLVVDMPVDETPPPYPYLLTNAAPAPLGGMNSVELMREFAQMVNQAGLQACVVLLDGLDEFPQTADHAELAIAFLAPLLGTLQLIECPSWAFKFFLPQELAPHLHAHRWFRTDRLRLFPIDWREEDLLNLIGQRLTHFSSSREPPYEDLGQLCEDELAQIVDRELATLADGLPRSALMLADRLLQEHCRRPAAPDRIALDTWMRVKRQWAGEPVGATARDEEVTAPAAEEPGSTPISEARPRPLLVIEEQKGLVLLDGQDIRNEINPQDYSVLLCLYRHHPEVCSKYQIALEAWPDVEPGGVSDQAIAASIARLRRVFRNRLPDIQLIKTVRSKQRKEGGYRLYPAGFR